MRDVSGAAQEARIVANFYEKNGKEEDGNGESRANDRQALPRSSCLRREGWLAKGWMLRGWETKREDFNVCLPREAIKINTSNYQAVLNFLAATIAVRRLFSPPPSPIAHPLPILRKFFLHRTARRISLHSRAFTLPWVPQLHAGKRS